MTIQFYTYIYYDPSRNNEPIYAGKGHGDRAWNHLIRIDRHPFVQRLQFMAKNGIKPIIGIINCKDEEEAFSYEIWFIYKFGRKDLGKGPLLNLTDGGDGASNPSQQTRIKIGAANKGKKRSAKTIAIMSARRKGVPTGRKGKPNPMKKTTPHGNTGKIRSVEFKENLSEMHKGKEAWNKDLSWEKLPCKYCGKLVDLGNMKQYHGDNCKYNSDKGFIVYESSIDIRNKFRNILLNHGINIIDDYNLLDLENFNNILWLYDTKKADNDLKNVTWKTVIIDKIIDAEAESITKYYYNRDGKESIKRYRIFAKYIVKIYIVELKEISILGEKE